MFPKKTTALTNIEQYSYFQSKRLLQIFWAVELALLFAYVQRLTMSAYLQSHIILLTSLVILCVYPSIKKGKTVIASTVLLSILTIFITYFTWGYSGLRDEVLLVYPCILIMAAMFGNGKLLLTLFVFISCSVLLNGIGNEYAWYKNIVEPIDTNSAILIFFIVSLTTYAIWVMAADFFIILQRLQKENDEVIHSKKQIEELIHHDALTGLPNRVMAQKKFLTALYSAKRSDKKAALMFIDLDNFKSLNDALGHQAGDMLLNEVSNRIPRIIRQSDTLCRFAGDEFIIIFESLTDESFLAGIAQSILKELQQPFFYHSNEFTCSCSIGIAVAPDDGEDFDSLIKKSDTAMYHSKSIGGNCFHFFDNEMNSQGHEYLALVTDLRKAVKENQLLLQFQPKIDLSTNTIVGAEALVRWHHPEKGLINPDEFISQAERSGLIIEIGQWVLNQACIECKRWHKQGLSELTIAINLSSQQFKRGNLNEIVLSALENSELPAKYIELELTESLLIENTTKLKESIKSLACLGVTFSIDDFGTGYSNLGYLKKFDISSLKIDRSFIRDIHDNNDNQAIVVAIIQMAKSLHLDVVAEGIENKSTAMLMKELQCDLGQGFYWTTPQTSEDFIAFIKKWNLAHL